MNIIFVSRTLEDHGLAGKFILTMRGVWTLGRPRSCSVGALLALQCPNSREGRPRPPSAPSARTMSVARATLRSRSPPHKRRVA